MAFPLLISCLFGDGPFDIYPAPDPDRYDCVFFTNRDEIAAHAEKRGWTACLMPYPGETDSLACALQSKAVKYLSFLDDPFFSSIVPKAKGGILYFDHKFRVTGDHVTKIVAHAEGASIVLRSTPRLKASVWDEVADAEPQERYARHMAETRRYMDRLLENGFSPDTRVCNTGVIYYADIAAAMPLTRQVFNACLLLRQPECQIFWALLAQPYKDDIRVIDWEDPAVADILWKNPHSPQTAPPPGILGRVRRKLRNLANRVTAS